MRYDIFSQNGYLLDFHTLLSPDDSLYRLLEPHLIVNTVIIEDNSIEYALNETHRYQAVTEEVTNGLDVSTFPMFQDAGFPAPVYLGVVGNSPRFPAAIQYIEYLAAAPAAADRFDKNENPPAVPGDFITDGGTKWQKKNPIEVSEEAEG